MSEAYGGVQAVAYRGAKEAIRPGRHFETGGKKEEKEKGKRKKRKKGKKEKGRKREKENMEEACDYSKTEMEHLICDALTHNLTCWRPCPFWGKRVVRRYVLLRKALKCIGS